MEACSYGPVNMQVIKTNPGTGMTQILSDDDTTYLYTRWVIDIIARISPETMSYDVGGANFMEPVATAPGDGNLPGMTVGAIRTVLMQPRQKLVVVAGGATILETPADNPAGGIYSCDALDGPRCEVVGITQIIGLVHFIAHLRFTAHVIDFTAQASPTGNVVLSNRWTATEDIDELCYPTRTFIGEAILRTDVMRAFDAADVVGTDNPPSPANFNADSVRSTFFFPVPNNYQRENVTVQLSSDGSRLQWSFTDVGRCYNLGANSPIRKIEAYQDFYVTAGGPQRALAQHILQAPGTMINNIGPIPRPDLMLRPDALIGLSNIRNSASGARDAFYLNNMPQYVKHCRVDLWGARNANRGQLIGLAMSVCMQQAGGLNDQGVLMIGSWQIIVRQALHHKFASVEITTKWSEDALSAIGLQNNQLAFPVPAPTAGTNVPLNLAAIQSSVGPQDRLRGAPTLGAQLVLDQSGAVTTNPGFTQNCRGNSISNTNTLIVALVSQILQDPNGLPSAPGIPMPR